MYCSLGTFKQLSRHLRQPGALGVLAQYCWGGQRGGGNERSVILQGFCCRASPLVDARMMPSKDLVAAGEDIGATMK